MESNESITLTHEDLAKILKENEIRLTPILLEWLKKEGRIGQEKINNINQGHEELKINFTP